MSVSLNQGYFSEDTIAAVITALGGPVCVIRLSGPGAFAALERLTGSSPEPRKLQRVALRDLDGGALDDALAVRFVRPDSYTGEDVVEFHLHGSSFIVSKLLQDLAKIGVRQALPGEFSFRSVRNGKMSLSQAQAVVDLIAASNESAVALALEKMEGSQSRLVHEIAEELRELAAQAELGIDFSDQEIDELGLKQLKLRALAVNDRLRALEAGYDRGARVQDGLRVVFAGLPNAGKSSFFNALLGENRAIVSSQAGTTRDLIHEHLYLRGKHSGLTLRLQDTAGLRSSPDLVERDGIERTRRAVAEADLVLLLVDAPALCADPANGVAAVREQWLQLACPAERTLGVLTKMDLCAADAKPDAHLAEFQLSAWLPTSSTTLQGIPEAIRSITDYCERRIHRDQGEVLLTRLDQKEAVSQSLLHLNRAQNTSDIALFASDLRQALHSLSLLIGDTLPEDILNRIFSGFCIGK